MRKDVVRHYERHVLLLMEIFVAGTAVTIEALYQNLRDTTTTSRAVANRCCMLTNMGLLIRVGPDLYKLSQRGKQLMDTYTGEEVRQHFLRVMHERKQRSWWGPEEGSMPLPEELDQVEEEVQEEMFPSPQEKHWILGFDGNLRRLFCAEAAARQEAAAVSMEAREVVQLYELVGTVKAVSVWEES